MLNNDILVQYCSIGAIGSATAAAVAGNAFDVVDVQPQTCYRKVIHNNALLNASQQFYLLFNCTAAIHQRMKKDRIFKLISGKFKCHISYTSSSCPFAFGAMSIWTADAHNIRMPNLKSKQNIEISGINVLIHFPFKRKLKCDSSVAQQHIKYWNDKRRDKFRSILWFKCNHINFIDTISSQNQICARIRCVCDEERRRRRWWRYTICH